MIHLKKIFVTSIFIAMLLSMAGRALALGSAEPQDSKFIPQCALDNPTGNDQEGACRKIDIFVILLLNVANYVFGFIGALALLFFVYGGFMLILSQGSADKVKKGFEIMSAAAIGLVIAFGAYVLVKFLGESIGIENEFKLK